MQTLSFFLTKSSNTANYFTAFPFEVTSPYGLQLYFTANAIEGLWRLEVR